MSKIEGKAVHPESIAQATYGSVIRSSNGGITLLEQATLMAMQGFCANPNVYVRTTDGQLNLAGYTLDEMGDVCVSQAKAVLAALDRSKQ